MCVLSRFCHVRPFATLWTAAHRVPLSMGFSRQEHWSGSPCPPPGESSWRSDWTWASCIGRTVLYHWATWEAPLDNWGSTLLARRQTAWGRVNCFFLYFSFLLKNDLTNLILSVILWDHFSSGEWSDIKYLPTVAEAFLVFVFRTFFILPNWNLKKKFFF